MPKLCMHAATAGSNLPTHRTCHMMLWIATVPPLACTCQFVSFAPNRQHEHVDCRLAYYIMYKSPNNSKARQKIGKHHTNLLLLAGHEVETQGARRELDRRTKGVQNQPRSKRVIHHSPDLR